MTVTGAEAGELTTLDIVGPLLAERLDDDAWRHASASLIAGGKSNLTFEVKSDAGTVILRRPPTGKLLPRAHDMDREAMVQAALADTDVPVPRIVVSDGGDLTGFQFYVMEKAEGHVIRDDLPPGYAQSLDDRQALADALVDTLADLHQVNPDEVGLTDFGRPEGFAERQVKLWTKQWQRAATRDVAPMNELGAALAQRVPVQQASSIVHGDFRLDNTVMDANDPSRVAAVLDWELSTLGDPLTDLGLFLLYWRQPGDHALTIVPDLTKADGFPSREYVVERYAARTGLDVSDLAFYEALAHYKFAAIIQGIAARVSAGSMAGQDFGDLDGEVLATARTGLDILNNDRKM